MKAMVLAAGKGTRLMPLTGEIPKPLAPVAGKPIISHIFELLSGSGIEEVHVNVHYLADAMLGYYGHECRFGATRVFLSREKELMGTAGGVKRLSGHFDDTFVVIMGDALTDVDLGELISFHKEHGALATLALMRVEDTSQYGVVKLDAAGNIKAFQEKPHPSQAISALANTGIYVFEPQALDYIPKDTFFDFANDVFPRILEAGETFVGYENGFYWSDIGNLEAYRAAQRDVFAGRVRVSMPGTQVEENLWMEPESYIHPASELDGRAVLGTSALVGRGVSLSGDVSVGGECRVRSGATLKNSILLPGATVGEEAHVEDCIVGPGFQVRPGEHIRGGTMMRRPSAGRRMLRPPWSALPPAAAV